MSSEPGLPKFMLLRPVRMAELNALYEPASVMVVSKPKPGALKEGEEEAGSPARKLLHDGAGAAAVAVARLKMLLATIGVWTGVGVGAG